MAVVLLLITVGSWSTYGQERPDLKILVVNSYDQGMEWEQDIQKGIVEGLRRKGYAEGRDYELKVFCMDTKVTYTTLEQMEQRAQTVLELIEKLQPDLVFVNNDNALKYVAVTYTERYPEKKLPFVFSGINVDPTIYQPITSLEVPGGPLTGALERTPYFEAFSLAKEMLPNASRIVLLADASPSSTFIINAFQERYLEKVTHSPLQVLDYIQIATFKEWKETILEYQTKTDWLGILNYYQLRDERGRVVPAYQVADWTIQNNKLPELAFIPDDARDGFLAAVGVSYYKTGVYVGILGAEILEGSNPATIAILDPKLIDISFNLERAKMLGVKISARELAEAYQVFHSLRKLGGSGSDRP